MNKTPVAQQAKTASLLMPTQGMLQRKCACGRHTMGGGQCADCAKKKTGLQRKLTIGASNDPLEQEADRIADQVLAAPAHHAVSGAPPRIQRYAGQATGETGTVPLSVDRVLASGGRPLDPGLQQDMGRRFAHDFSRVRVHTGGAAEQSARDVNAHAYTVGQNIVFGAGQFAPESTPGRRLMAHELTHVVQQSGVDGVGAIRSHGNRCLSPVYLPQPTLQRKPDAEAKTDVESNDKLPKAPPPTKLAPEGAGLAQNVERIVISCQDMKLRLDTPGQGYLYRMESCSRPTGSFKAKVTLTENDFNLDFGNVVGADQRFDFSYVVDPGQTCYLLVKLALLQRPTVFCLSLQ